MSEETQSFTQEQVNQVIEKAKKKWIKEELEPIRAERDELMQYKPKELTDEQKEIERLKAENRHLQTVQMLREANLEDFVDFLNVENEEELQVKIDQLTEILNNRKLKNSYVPQDHRQTDVYTQAEKSGNVQQMISAKLSKLFN